MSHYFDEEPGTTSEPKRVSVVLPGDAFDYDTDRGVFAYGRLDVGTKILLQEAPPPPPSGNFLDLGCGAGPIAIALARRSRAARVWAVDVNERALELVRRNARRLELDNVTAASPDAVPADVRFDLVWSNPPIKIGKPELHEMLERWLARLAPQGVAILVVHKHLGSDSLADWLRGRGLSVDRIQSRRGYRLLRVTRSDTGRVDGDS